jgi:cytoskeletal protein CcmA (bactofilin family)
MNASLLAFLTVCTVGMFLLPLIPSFQEMRRPKDAGPMDVHAKARVDTRYFARSFRTLLERHCYPLLSGVRNIAEHLQGELPSGDPFVLLPGNREYQFSEQEQAKSLCKRIIVSAARLDLPEKGKFQREVYAVGDLTVGSRARVRAAYAEGDLRMRERSASDRWLHSDKRLHVESGCALYGRTTAGESIRIEGACGFERMRAPEIILGERNFDEGWRASRQPVEDCDVTKLPRFQSLSAGRALFSGSLVVGPRRYIPHSLVVLGDLHLGDGCHLQGSIKVHGKVVLAAGVRVDGSIVAHDDIDIGAGCRVLGPLLAERDLRISSRSQIGDGMKPATLRARRITLQMGSSIHGTVWATERGEVRA